MECLFGFRISCSNATRVRGGCHRSVKYETYSLSMNSRRRLGKFPSIVEGTFSEGFQRARSGEHVLAVPSQSFLSERACFILRMYRVNNTTKK